MTEECVEQDWGGLPKGVLQNIFDRLFSALEGEQPWRLVFQQILSLRSVCRHWAEALTDTPPPLHLCASAHCPGDVLGRLLPNWHVASLRVAQDEHDNYLEGLRMSDEPHLSWFSADVFNNNPQQFGSGMLPIGRLTQLRSLVLDLPDVWRFGIVFNAAPLSGLTALASLHVAGFKDYMLGGLPKSVSDLHLGYGGHPYHPNILSSHDISIPLLPPGHQLARLSLKKAGVVGLPMDRLWDYCHAIEVDAMFSLAGVPVNDDALVVLFERPYREGDYVPPHIFGDMEAAEASNRAADATANHFLLGAARSQVLERLDVKGECASSLKMVPGWAGNTDDAISFLHSVTQQALYTVYGMSGAELMDRMLDMRANGRLPSGALHVELEDGHKGFRLVVDSRIVGGDEEKDGQPH